MFSFQCSWWSLAGSNRWPPACKAGALPAELRPQNLITGREDRIRTCDPLVPNQVLYQAELLPVYMARPAGVEPTTFWSVVRRSIQLSYGRIYFSKKWCRGPESNRYGSHLPQDFKSCASASSATPALKWIYGAEDEVRTRDPHLGKVVFYHWTTSARL